MMKTWSVLLLSLVFGFAAPDGRAATQLLAVDFGSDMTLNPPYIQWSAAGWQTIQATNKVSGEIGPVRIWNASEFGYDMIADVPVTLATLGNYIANEVQWVAGPRGSYVNAMLQTVKINNATYPTYGASQDAFQLIRDWSTNPPDILDGYYSLWFKTQPALATIMVGGDGAAYRVMSELKTGGLQNSYRGDFRIITHIKKEGNQLFWETEGDDCEAAEISGNPLTQFWVVANRTVSVPVGQWFFYEVYWHRSTGGDGRYWSAVNGQIIVDYHGMTKIAATANPWTRIYFNNVYGSGGVPMQSWTTSLEIWDGFPCGVGVSCYVPPSSTPSIAAPTNLRVR